MSRLNRSLAVLAAAAVMATAGCASGGDEPAKSDSAAPATSKTKISIMYGFSGDQEKGFKADMEAFAKKNNLEIEYQPSTAFETQISANIEAGKIPDIAIFPQPGILQGMAKKGLVAKLDSQVDVENVKKNIPNGFLDVATVDGAVYGAPFSMNVKSLYWYNKPVFEKKGWTAPKTHDELKTLMGKMKAEGKTPICYGMGSGSATGWPATDWIEDYVLQANGPEVYDKWLKGEVKFSSPEVKKALDIYNEVIMADGQTLGTAKNSASVQFNAAFNPMFAADPQCYLGKQGNFITTTLPASAKNDIDGQVGVFQTPSVNGQSPVEGGGDLVAAFTKNDANVKKIMNFLTNDPTFGVESAKTGSFLSPQKGFDKANYPNKLLGQISEIGFNASTFRFDGSDAMPGAVGSGAFWKEMVAYTSGQTNLETAMKNIDDAWPAE